MSEDNEPHEQRQPSPAEGIELRGDSDDEATTSRIAEPGRLLRIGYMLRALQAELHADGVDVPSRDRLRLIHERASAQLAEVVSGSLGEELEAFTLPFDEEGEPPSESELRIAHAQLIGWLEGVFHGIQAAVASQQPDPRQLAQLQQAAGRQGLGAGDGEQRTPGQYL